MKLKNYYPSPVGILALVADDDKVVAISFEDVEGTEAKSDTLDLMKRWLDEYFKGNCPSVDDVPFEIRGSAFQKEVWKLLLEIPYGKTVTYGELAKKIAQRRGIRKMASQAVGNAVGANPLAILVPCHRVMGANNDLRGYGGGITKKVALLKIEGSFENDFYYRGYKHNF